MGMVIRTLGRLVRLIGHFGIQSGSAGGSRTAGASGDRVQHRRAGLFTAPALLSADAAVLVVLGMPLALLRAYVAQLSARGHLCPGSCCGVLRLPREKAAGCSADVGAIQAEA